MSTAHHIFEKLNVDGKPIPNKTIGIYSTSGVVEIGFGFMRSLLEEAGYTLRTEEDLTEKVKGQTE